MKLITIDPGVSGALAVSDGTLEGTKAYNMPKGVKAISDFMEPHKEHLCISEQVNIRSGKVQEIIWMNYEKSTINTLF